MYNDAATLENSQAVSQMMNVELPYDPAVLLLGEYPREVRHMPT